MQLSCAWVILLLVGLRQTVDGHFIWLMENSTNDAIVTFGEDAGVPSASMFLNMVADKIHLSTHDARGQHNVTLSTQSLGLLRSELVGHVDAAPPFSLRLSATYGIFHGGSLLQYWGAADVVAEPNDWFKIQDWVPQKGLEITIRDPWMNRSSDALSDRIALALQLADPGDECKPHQGPLQDGAACVVAVVRFNGELLDSSVILETFDGNGAKLNTTQSQSGVTILKVPLDKTAPFTPVWAKVGYHENVPGQFQGQKYTYVDHWATTYSRIQRAASSAVMMI
jgi:hypothetical protein